MCDDLVATLHQAGHDYTDKAADLIKAQAARIAELEAAVTQCRTLSAMLKPQADRIAELEAALATARREGMEEAAKIAENEPEPEGEPPIELHGRSVKNIAISSVRATKHSIAAAIRAALEGGEKDE